MNQNCHKCQKELPYKDDTPIGRSDRCPYCNADLRVCLACKFFDKSSYNECKEPVAERVVEKEKANFCDYYKYGLSSNLKSLTKEEILAKANALFKK